MKKVEAARQLFVEQLDFLDRHKYVNIHDELGSKNDK